MPVALWALDRKSSTGSMPALSWGRLQENPSRAAPGCSRGGTGCGTPNVPSVPLWLRVGGELQELGATCGTRGARWRDDPQDLSRSHHQQLPRHQPRSPWGGRHPRRCWSEKPKEGGEKRPHPKVTPGSCLPFPWCPTLNTFCFPQNLPPGHGPTSFNPGSFNPTDRALRISLPSGNSSASHSE